MKRLLPLLLASTSLAQTPLPPAPPQAPPPKPQLLKRVPPPGIALTTAERAELTAGVEALGKEVAALEKDLAGKPAMLALLPDVLIFHKAVDWALRYDEFFTTGHIAQARQQLEMGKARAAELRAGKPSWNAISGADTKPTADGKDKLPAMVVRAYRSKIDGSIQPYGIILPEDYRPGENKPRPLHFWAHGRGEKLSELDFINQRLTSKGEFTPPGAFVLHLYGRYCNANKFAGEVDLFEALADAKKHYPIDDARLVMRGFSMGGAAVWQFGTHFAGMWAVVQPGAGFAESKEFLKLGLTPEKPLPSEWEQKLWRWYDSTLYVSNLKNTTTVAYSGEIDGQKQACDIMIRYARQEAGNANPPVAELNKVNPGDGSPKAEEARVAGTAPDLTLYHVTAPNVPHKISPEAKVEIEKLVEAAVARRDAATAPPTPPLPGAHSRSPSGASVPKKIHFTTYTLVYPRMSWLTVVQMEKQWERADVLGEIVPGGINVKTSNVAALHVEVPYSTFPDGPEPKIKIEGAEFPLRKVSMFDTTGKDEETIRKLTAHPEWKVWQGLIQKTGSGWRDAQENRGPRKEPGLCGPIDHAFMDSFVFVRPTGKQLNKVVGDWVEGELGRAVAQWRAVFRGDARVVADTALTEDDIKNSNLVLWGDPTSNSVLRFLLTGLKANQSALFQKFFGDPTNPPTPSALGAILKWDGKQLVFGGKTYDAATTAPVLIFPNPLNPQKYVVLNSGFTFREAAAINNAQQTPKLPDWAIIDLRTAPDAYQPGKILRAGFFDEQWQPPAQ